MSNNDGCPVCMGQKILRDVGLSEVMKTSIRRLYKKGWPIESIADRHEITIDQVNKIIDDIKNPPRGGKP